MAILTMALTSRGDHSPPPNPGAPTKNTKQRVEALEGDITGLIPNGCVSCILTYQKIFYMLKINTPTGI
jgi:hypothetical protein